MARDGDGTETLVRVESSPHAVVRLDEAVVLDLFGDRPYPCGHGSWCDACRKEIREEAMLWLRELNDPRGRTESTSQPADPDHRLLYRWSEHTMLADLSIDP